MLRGKGERRGSTPPCAILSPAAGLNPAARWFWCMYDPAPESGPLSPQEWMACAILMLFILGLFAADVVHDFHPIKLSALLIIIFWIPLLVLHEGGHALMAAALGWHVGQIVIGMGRTARQFRIGTALVQIRLVPVSGFVMTVPTDLNMPQIKSALIYFAGPGIELLFAAILVFLVGPDRMFQRTDEFVMLSVQSLAVAATVQAGLNLIPYTTMKGQSRLISDGMGIFLSLMTPTSQYAARIGQRFEGDRFDGEHFDPDKQERRREEDWQERWRE
jgi:Peptidase family M50